MPSADSSHVELQPRDFALLKGFFESRIMTLAQIAAIHFGGSGEAAKKRIQKLKAAGYLAERPRRAYDPSILFLTRKSFTVLESGGYLDEYPPLAWTNLEKRARVSDLTLRHELDVMNFKAAVYTALAKHPALSIIEFSTWPLLYEFTASPNDGMRSMTVRPDGFIRLREKYADGTTREHALFLEVDRSTEVLDTLVTRSQCYRDFYRRGGLAWRNGRPHAEFERFSFRVLIIVRNAERRNNLCERLLALRPPILSQVWMSTFDEAATLPLGAIWVTPRAYRSAIEGTPMTAMTTDTRQYRRNTAREVLVETRIKRKPLLIGREP